MNSRRNTGRRTPWLKPALAGMCVALLLGIVFAAAVAPLHQSLHDDCHHERQAERHCTVCAFVKGQVDAVDFEPPVVARHEAPRFVFPPVSIVPLPAVDFLLLPERAPPFAS